jgi:hypothetical protein
MTQLAAPAVHDLVTSPTGTVRIEYVTADAYLVNSYGDRWSLPVEQLILARPAVRGGAAAVWAVSQEWTA